MVEPRLIEDPAAGGQHRHGYDLQSKGPPDSTTNLAAWTRAAAESAKADAYTPEFREWLERQRAKAASASLRRSQRR